MATIRSVVFAVVVFSLAVAPLSAAAGGGASADRAASADGPVVVPTEDADRAPAAGPASAPALPLQEQEEEEPTTEETIGYVEGYWYDDDLEVDESDGLAEDELQAVVYRSMARVEVIRNRTFEDEVPVDVVSREEYRAENEGRFAEVTEAERFYENIRLETLFLVDRETDAVDAFQELYGAGVAGYYDQRTDEIVIVSENTESPQLDELTLGHELVHALQDQHFNLSRFDATTRDGLNAENGLIEGDASRVEREYESLCGVEWDCLLPEDEGPAGTPDLNLGLYLTFYHPYSDGPAFVEHLRDGDDWSPVDAAYDDPPTASSQIIRPEEYGSFEPAEIEVEDRSADRWSVVAGETEPGYSAFGEAAMFSMLLYPTLESGGETAIIDQTDFLNPDDELAQYDYDHEYTDGWAGDRMIAYATDERSMEESGYVWRTEWRSPEEAEGFLEGYAQLLEYRGAEPVDDRQNTFVIDAAFPGAYYVEHDGTSVTIVRAPSVDELAEIRDGAAPEGDDTVVLPAQSDDGENGTDGNETDETADGNGTGAADGEDDTGTDDGTDTDGIPGFGAAVAVVAIVVAALTARGRR